MALRRSIPLFLIPLLVSALAALGALNGGAGDFPHAVHRESGLECVDCHEGAEKEARAGIPAAELCRDCHEEPKEESEKIAAFFRERDDGSGGLSFRASLHFEELKFSHAAHHAAGAECADCHGDVPGGDLLEGGDPDFKHACLDCHGLMEASLACEACHEQYRKDVRPEDHGLAEFGRTHGHGVTPYFVELPEGRCFYCHSVSWCRDCHEGTRPAWHDLPLFRRHHGDEISLAHDSMADAGCLLCHEEGSCAECHARQEPLSHTPSFKNRTHGFEARMERRSCQMCHLQSFCTDCHGKVEPISHRGTFRRGPQNHCYRCHPPLSENGCYVCHKTILGHDALPRPTDATHLGATGNSCRICHAPPPHADNGLDCTRCH